MIANAKGRKMTDHVSVQTKDVATLRVWDPLVRVFHWGLVAAFATAWLTADELQPVHEFAGYTVAGLVAFRLIWGFAGSRYARFAQFVKGPGATLAYLGSMLRGGERRYLGHNTAGAAMIVALLLTLSGTAFTGWLMAGPTVWRCCPPCRRSWPRLGRTMMATSTARNARSKARSRRSTRPSPTLCLCWRRCMSAVLSWLRSATARTSPAP